MRGDGVLAANSARAREGVDRAALKISQVELSLFGHQTSKLPFCEFAEYFEEFDTTVGWRRQSNAMRRDRAMPVSGSYPPINNILPRVTCVIATNLSASLPARVVVLCDFMLTKPKSLPPIDGSPVSIISLH